MKRIIALFLVLVMSFALVACGSKTDAPAKTDAAAKNDAPVVEQNNKVAEYYLNKANEVKVTDTEVIFTDDGSGKEMSVAKNPKNAAVLYGSLVALWYEAGGTVPLAIGGKSAVDLYKEQIGRDVTQDKDVKVVSTSSSGTNWDIESILAEKPDLIVTSVGMKGYATIAKPAAAVGIPVIGINYDGVQDYLKWFKVFCNLTGHPELWNEVADKTAKGIIDVVSKVPKKDTAPTAVILVVSSDTLKAYTTAAQPGTIMKDLGGVNLVDPKNDSSKESVAISLEDLQALDPDILFLSWYNEPGQMYNQLMDMVKGNPVWESLRANKEGRFFQLDRGLYHNKANHMYDQAYKTMAEYLYPDFTF